MVRSTEDRPGDCLLAALPDLYIDDETHVWAAGEAAAMQCIRKYLFNQRKVARSRAVVRGYWKHGR